MRGSLFKLRDTISSSESSSESQSSRRDFSRNDFDRRQREAKAKETQPKPEYFGTYHAEVFKDKQVVDVYHYRPLYPQEVFGSDH